MWPRRCCHGWFDDRSWVVGNRRGPSPRSGMTSVRRDSGREGKRFPGLIQSRQSRARLILAAESLATAACAGTLSRRPRATGLSVGRSACPNRLGSREPVPRPLLRKRRRDGGRRELAALEAYAPVPRHPKVWNSCKRSNGAHKRDYSLAKESAHGARDGWKAMSSRYRRQRWRRRPRRTTQQGEGCTSPWSLRCLSNRNRREPKRHVVARLADASLRTDSPAPRRALRRRTAVA